MREMLKSKIHRAWVTEVNLEYEGSVTLDPLLMEAADILPYEQVHVLDVTNGARLVTYAMQGERGAGVVCMNGAAAHLVHQCDCVIILGFQTVDEEEARRAHPHVVHVDKQNRVVRVSREEAF